jgi:hypothetical protein
MADVPKSRYHGIISWLINAVAHERGKPHKSSPQSPASPANWTVEQAIDHVQDSFDRYDAILDRLWTVMGGKADEDTTIDWVVARRFADAARVEREACAQVAREVADRYAAKPCEAPPVGAGYAINRAGMDAAIEIETAIRARGIPAPLNLPFSP